eukprot:9471314-Pyramimonas_sp.AAC.1
MLGGSASIRLLRFAAACSMLWPNTDLAITLRWPARVILFCVRLSSLGVCSRCDAQCLRVASARRTAPAMPATRLNGAFQPRNYAVPRSHLRSAATY